MKIALFALGVLAFAQGIHLEGDSSMVVEFDYEEDEPNPNGAGVTDNDIVLRNFCHGFAEIRTEFNDEETVHGKISKNEGEVDPKKASKLKYKAVPGGRSARKIIEVQGNCCWNFYQKNYYRGTLKSVRNSGYLYPNFAPRSLKVVEC